MRVFHELVFDGYISPGFIGSDFRYYRLLGLADNLSISGYLTQVSGTALSFAVTVMDSLDGYNWQQRNQVAFSPNPVAGQDYEFQMLDSNPNSAPKQTFAGILLALGGTNASAYARVWVTGRDKSRQIADRVRAAVEEIGPIT